MPRQVVNSGFFLGEHLAYQAKLKAVANFAAKRGVVWVGYAPALGVHIRAAGDGKTVCHLYVALDNRIVVGKRHQHGQSACGQNRIHEHGGDAFVGREGLTSYDVAFFPARGDQNEGTFAFEGILHKAAFMVRQCVRFICRGVVGAQQGRNSNT